MGAGIKRKGEVQESSLVVPLGEFSRGGCKVNSANRDGCLSQNVKQDSWYHIYMHCIIH